MTQPDTPYRPSNGTEGADFEDRWCERCAQDAAFREDMDGGEGCEILCNATLGEQPSEWVFRDRIPTCTAFTDKPLPEPRCEFTKEMF